MKTPLGWLEIQGLTEMITFTPKKIKKMVDEHVCILSEYGTIELLLFSVLNWMGISTNLNF